MQQIHIDSVPSELSLTLTQKRITLPPEAAQKVGSHWQQLVKKNPHLHNGEVFTIVNRLQDAQRMAIELAITDYAHHLYSRHVGGLGANQTSIIHPCAVILTQDLKLIVGAMAEHTSSPGEILCCGGGLDFADVKDGMVLIDNTIAKELREELNIDCSNKQAVSLTATFLITDTAADRTTVAYIARLNQTSEAFAADYREFAKQLVDHGELPEFKDLFYIPATEDAVANFTRGHTLQLQNYVPLLLKAVVKQLKH